jgi:hypothetical protein
MRACTWAKFFLLRVVGASPRTQDHQNERRKCAMQRFVKRIVVADMFVCARGKDVQMVTKFFDAAEEELVSCRKRASKGRAAALTGTPRRGHTVRRDAPEPASCLDFDRLRRGGVSSIRATGCRTL